MSKLSVVLINPADVDVSVGVGSAQIVAKAGSATSVLLPDSGLDAYGLLSQGVAIVPADMPLDDGITRFDFTDGPPQVDESTTLAEPEAVEAGAADDDDASEPIDDE